MITRLAPLALLALAPAAFARPQCPAWNPDSPNPPNSSPPPPPAPPIDLGTIRVGIDPPAGQAETPPPTSTPSGPVGTPGSYAGPTTPTSAPSTPVVSGGCTAQGAFASPLSGALTATTQGPVSLNDPTSWQTWWSFNRDGLLGLRAELERGGVTTGDDDYFVGRGVRDLGQGLRPHEGLVRERVVPALLAALEDATSPRLEAELLVALARIGAAPAGGEIDDVEAVIQSHVGHPQASVAETAVLALGILGRPGAVRTLEHVVADCEDGRRMAGRDQVSRRMRSFGAYALGLTAQRSGHEEARRYAAMRLTSALDLWSESTDLQVACVTSLGIDPLACSTRTVGNAEARRASGSREALVAELLGLLDDPRTSWQTEAHTVTALARQCEGAPAEVRASVVERLIECVKPRSKSPEEVRRSAIIALGRLGTAGGDELERKLRTTLERALHHGPQASRNFALVALGEAAGRAGSGEEPWAGTAAARSELLRIAVGSGGTERPWAALALGLLERTVERTGGVPSSDTRQALQRLLEGERSPSDRAALALALGLTGDAGATEVLRDAFADVRDDATRGSIAVGLGLLGDDRAIEDLRAALAEAQRRPLLLRECAIGLALLDDANLVPGLVEELEECDDVATRMALADALADVGDQRCVEPLARLLQGDTGDRIAAARALGRVCDTELLPWTTVLATGVNYLAATETLTSAGVGVLDLR